MENVKNTDGELTSLFEVYRVSTSPKKITETLKKSKELQQSIMWQTQNGEKIIYPFELVEFVQKENKLTVTYQHQNELVDPDQPIFVKLYFRETLFKGKIEKFEGNKLTISVPKEIHVREYRNSIRVSFLPDEEWVEIRILTPGVASHRLGIMKIALKDVSRQGLGFTISKSNAHLFKNGQLIEVLGFSEVKLKTPIVGAVVYSNKIITNERKIVYKVGLHLNEKIQQETFNKIIKNKKEVLQTTAGHLLESKVFKEDFREHIKTEINRTLEKLKRRPALSDYLKCLEVTTSNNDYLLEHIKVLNIVSIYIGQAMGWPNWISVEKLTCAAYLHDLAFIDQPRLAKIQNLGHFEKLKSQLTEDEKKVYLDSPSKVLEIVKKDSDSFPIVQEMIFHQKELPDGSGFPQGICAEKIPLHSALFILSHDLTHEIMSNFDWTLERWLLRVSEIYQQEPFKDIIATLMRSKNKIMAYVYTSDSL